jgi:Mrp family chromosome partitioning ATPase
MPFFFEAAILSRMCCDLALELGEREQHVERQDAGSRVILVDADLRKPRLSGGQRLRRQSSAGRLPKAAA